MKLEPHSNVYSGLCEHSIGEYYPYSVVGYGYPVEWAIVNLLTSERITEKDNSIEAMDRKLFHMKKYGYIKCK